MADISKEQAVQLAREAGLGVTSPNYPGSFFFSDIAGAAELERFTALVEKLILDAAKEACTKLPLYGSQDRRNWQEATIADCVHAIESLKDNTP